MPRKPVKRTTPEEKSVPQEEVVEAEPAVKKAPPKRKAAPRKKAAPKAKATPKKAADKKVVRKPRAKKKPVKAEESSDEDSAETTEASSNGKREFNLVLDSIYYVNVSGDFKTALTDLLKAGDVEDKKQDIGEELNREKLPKKGGKYTGKNPLQSAKKAFTAISGAFSAGFWDEDSPIIIFSVLETTKGGKGNTFHYFGTREKLDSPNEISRGGSSYLVKYKNSVKSAKMKKAPRVPKSKKKEEEPSEEEEVEDEVEEEESEEAEDEE